MKPAHSVNLLLAAGVCPAMNQDAIQFCSLNIDSSEL